MKETKTGQVLDISLLFRVIRYAKPYKKQFIIAATAAILLSFLGPARPMLINWDTPSVGITSNSLHKTLNTDRQPRRRHG